jgi:hypothetical protein
MMNDCRFASPIVVGTPNAAATLPSRKNEDVSLASGFEGDFKSRHDIRIIFG